jgi:transposase-like protein
LAEAVWAALPQRHDRCRIPIVAEEAVAVRKKIADKCLAHVSKINDADNVL